MEKNSGRRVKKSEPDFDKLFNLANELAMAMNPQRWFNLTNREELIEGGLEGETRPVGGMDVSEEERLEVVCEIRRLLEIALAEAPTESLPAEFLEFLEKIDFSPLDEGY